MPSALAQSTYYWDPTGAGSSTTGAGGGSYNWDAISPYWFNGSTDTTWTSGKAAYFAGQMGSVNVAGNITTGGIITDPAAWGGSSYVITDNGAIGQLAVGAGGISAGSSVQIGSSKLQLVLSASQTWSAGPGANLYVAGPVNSAYQLNVAGLGNTTIGGSINGGGNFTMNGPGALTLSATGSTIGNLTVNSGAVAATTLSNSNALGGASVTLNGGTLSLTQGAVAGYTTTIPTLTAGGGVLALNASANSTTLGITNLVRPANDGTLLLQPSSGNLFTKEKFTITKINGSGSATAIYSDGTNAMLPGYIIVQTAPTGGYPYGNFASISGGAIMRATYDSGNINSSDGIVWDAQGGGTNVLGGSVNPYALTVESDATSVHLNGNTLTIGNSVTLPGGLILNGGNISGPGTLAFAGEGFVYAGRGFATISANLSGSHGITISGLAALILSGTNTALTGPMTLNGAMVKVETDNNLPSATSPLVFNGGTLAFTATSGVVADSRSITMNPAGGAINVAAGGAIALSGAMSGVGPLTIGGGGAVILTGTNSNSGDTTISGGTLQLGDGTAGHDGFLATSRITNNAALVYSLYGNQIPTYPIGGTGSVTKSGPGTLVLPYSNTYTGSTAITGGTLQIPATGALANNSSNKVLVAKDADGVFGDGIGDAAIIRNVAANGTYAGLGSAITNLGTGELPTTADILGGNASAQADVSMTWRTRTAAEKTQAGGGLISEILNLDGLVLSGGGSHHGSLQTDMFVLEMSYDPNSLLSIWGLTESQAVAQDCLYLGYLDLGEDGLLGGTGLNADHWSRAVDGNFGGMPNFVGNHAYNSSYFVLGDYGVDTTNHVVWAVVDHSSQFAVVPEPSTFALLTIGGICLLGLAWRRNQRAFFVGNRVPQAHGAKDSEMQRERKRFRMMSALPQRQGAASAVKCKGRKGQQPCKCLGRSDGSGTRTKCLNSRTGSVRNRHARREVAENIAKTTTSSIHI